MPFKSDKSLIFLDIFCWFSYNNSRGEFMLLQFRVGNFLSFNEIQTFSMEAGKVRNFSERLYKDGKYKLLKFMSIYGANASGKSNLVYAFSFFKDIVFGGFESGSYSHYCKLVEENKDKASFFEIKIEINKKTFVYGFEVILNNSSLQKEWLYEETKSEQKNYVFFRNILDKKFTLGSYIKTNTLKERINIYADDIKSDDSILFLKLMNQNKDNLYATPSKITVFKDVYNWIRFKLTVTFPERPITNYSWMIDSNNLDVIAEKLNHFSTGIEKITVSNIAPEKVNSTLPKEIIKDIHNMLSEQKHNNKEGEKSHKPAVLIRSPENSMFIVSLNEEGMFKYKTLEFKHKNSNAKFSLEDESDGTVRLLDIIEILLNNDDNKVYIIDEINRMFHPLLTIKFVEEFLELAKERKIQLIVTTHESQLMDLKLLRKDEINFINKDENGFSTIRSLDEFDDRFDKKIISEYFRGKYDAIPFPKN